MWADYKRKRGLLGGTKPAQPTAAAVAEGLEDASDEQIEQAYRATMRQRANAVRRAYANPAEQISAEMQAFDSLS